MNYQSHKLVPLDGTRRRALNLFNYYVYTNEIKIEKVKNCICNCNKFETLNLFDRYGLPFGSQICTDCGLISQTIRINPNCLKKFYQEIYWDLISGDTKQTFLTPTKHDETKPFILNFIPRDLKEINLIEIGCGSGDRLCSVIRALESDKIVNAFGCDFSEDALNIAKNKKIKTVLGDIKDISKLGVKADVVIMSHILEHLPDLNNAMEELKEITKIDSLIYVEVPGVGDLKNKSEYLYDYQLYSVLAHTFNFTLDTLTNVMNSGGFELIDGDEYIRAVFKRTNNQKPYLKNKETYLNTINFINQANLKCQSFDKKKFNKIYRYLKNIIKAVLGRSYSSL